MGTSYNTNVVTDGLIGCWDAGNRRSYPGTGTTWTDLAGGIQGTLMNEDDDALNFNSSKGGYFELDGTDGRVDCGDNLICTWSEVSICLWASATDISSGSMGMVSRGHGVVFEFSMSMDTAQKCLSCLVDGGWLLSDAGSLNSYFGKWTHYAMRWITGTDNFRLYINGEVVKTGTQSIVNIGSSGKQNLCIGDRGLVNNKEFNGDIGPVYIYDRALSDDEIKQNYEATKSRFLPRITTDGLFASWDAGDPASYPGGTTLKDTANHYDGTFVNNGSGGDVSFDSANGGSLVFDGSDDYVNITTLPDYSGTARSAIIWLAVDSWAGASWAGNTSTPFQSAVDQFCVSFGQGNGNMYWRSANSGSNNDKYITPSSTPSAGSWHCWAVTINASDEIVAMYHNGESKSSGTGAAFTIKNKTSIGCRIGTDGSSVENSLEGKVGSLRLYTKTLSAAEIMDNFQKTRGRFGV